MPYLQILLFEAAKAFLVVASALVFIAEDAISCGQLPELLSRCFSLGTLVLVRVIGQCQLAVCAMHGALPQLLCRKLYSIAHTQHQRRIHRASNSTLPGRLGRASMKLTGLGEG